MTVNAGKLEKGSGSEYEVELVAEVSIALLDRREVSLIFDEFPMDTIQVKDIKEVIADGIGSAIHDVYMVRIYPTLRPVTFHDEQLMMGFHGKKSKGLWEDRYVFPKKKRVRLSSLRRERSWKTAPQTAILHGC